MDVAKVGSAIKALRVKAGFTQQSLAECLDVTDKAVSKWERGLGVPDISLFSKLSVLLNTDIDNLLDGNVIFLEHKWRGLLLLDEVSIPPDTKLRGKPILQILLSYFMLSGIRDVDVVASEADAESVKTAAADCAKLGITVRILPDKAAAFERDCDTMLVCGNAFLYGPNTTKYFQRAISRGKGITFLAIPQTNGSEKDRVCFDSKRAVREFCEMPNRYYKLPFIFYTREARFRVRELMLQKKNPGMAGVFAEPLGKGMIFSGIETWDDVVDLSVFLAFLEKKTGDRMYCLEEIAWRRGFITKEQLSLLAQESRYDREYLETLLAR